MKPDIVIVTGSRDWTDRETIRNCLLSHPKGTVLIHGDCRGADKIAASVGRNLGYQNWPLPYFEENGRECRNESMVAVGVALKAKGHKVICYAFPLPGSIGSVKTMRLMRSAGLMVRNWDEYKGYE